MIKDAEKLLKEIDQLLDEIDVHSSYKNHFMNSLKRVQERYHKKKFGYTEYQNQINALLKDRSKEEWILYYDSYILSLLRRIDFLLSELFTEVAEDNDETQKAGLKQEQKIQQEENPEIKKEGKTIQEEREIRKQSADEALKKERISKGMQMQILSKRLEEEEIDGRLQLIRQKLSAQKYPSQSLKYVLVKKPEHLHPKRAPEAFAKNIDYQAGLKPEGPQALEPEEGHQALKLEETPQLISEEIPKKEAIGIQIPEMAVPKLQTQIKLQKSGINLQQGPGILDRLRQTLKKMGQDIQEAKQEFSEFPSKAKEKLNFSSIRNAPHFWASKIKDFRKIISILHRAPEIKDSQQIKIPEKKKAGQETAEEQIDFGKIAQKSKLYSAQRMKAISKPRTGSKLSGIPSSFGKGAVGVGKFALKIPVNLGKAVLFTAKLPVRTVTGAVKLTFNGLRMISRINKKKVGKKEIVERPSFLEKVKNSLFGQKEKTIFVEEIVQLEKQTQKTETGLPKKQVKILTGGILDIKLFKDIFRRMGGKEEKLIGEQTEIPEHIKKLREMRQRLKEGESEYGFERTLFAKEARRVKEMLEAERAQVYQGSSIGAVANFFVKRTAVSLVDTFPELFEQLYNSLRSANIKILSNTYVSIMVFFSVGMFLAVSAGLSAIFFALNYPLYHILFSSLIFGFIAAAATSIFFYAYPFMKIGDRKRNITANLPFAMNHLSAVSASGVPPGSMFELISGSKEYGEISIEFKKIVNLMTVFGYDLLTAIRAVSATTPDPAFKEILDGMVSTIETGGDLESYLKEKAEEATLTYRLERQRYNESIATYSDIYTGLLIAAPLFFISALAAISLLGGTIGGFGIDVIMAFGAYIAIPFLNIAFLIFLQMNQPES